MRKCILLILIISILLAGCTSIQEGEIYRKEFIPEHTETGVTPMHMYNGTSTTTILMPYTNHYSDKWVIYIRNFSEDGGTMYTNKFEVEEKTYENLKVGDWYSAE